MQSPGRPNAGRFFPPLKQAAPLALEEAHSATGDNAARILQSDGSNRYSLGFFVLMMGVITPFT